MRSWLSTPMPRWYALLITAVSVGLLALAGVGYTNYSLTRADAAERENDRRWCQLLITLDDAYGVSEPTTEIGRRVASAVRTLRVSLKC